MIFWIIAGFWFIGFDPLNELRKAFLNVIEKTSLDSLKIFNSL